MKIRFRNIKVGLMAGLAWLASCDVLNQEPEALIPSSSAIVDSRSTEAALTGLYDALQSGSLYGGEFIMASELIAKNARAAAFQAFWAELGSGRVPASNFYVEDTWVASYAVINQANALISQVPDLSNVSEDQRNRTMGTAYFMRALAHFDLLRQYGEFENPGSPYGIPVVTEPFLEFTLEETPRATVAESFAQIESDLNQAVALLNSGDVKIRTSKGAAQALLARVYLYQKKYNQAEQSALAVIDDGNYALLDDYNGVYRQGGGNGTAESIFEVGFIELNDPNVWAATMYISPPEVAVTRSLFDFFQNNGETERGLFYEDQGSVIRCTKYGSSPNDNGANTIVMRLSEMYLILAEAQGLKAGANPEDGLDALNTVRTRAEMPAYDAVDIDTETKLVDALLYERRAEFAFEGHYWFDLVRYGRFEEVLGLESFRRRLPIPLREMNITDGTLVQNPGY